MRPTAEQGHRNAAGSRYLDWLAQAGKIDPSLCVGPRAAVCCGRLIRARSCIRLNQEGGLVQREDLVAGATPARLETTNSLIFLAIVALYFPLGAGAGKERLGDNSLTALRVGMHWERAV
jgi:hypothetical protein